jgi:hypothetical protein
LVLAPLPVRPVPTLLNELLVPPRLLLRVEDLYVALGLPDLLPIPLPLLPRWVAEDLGDVVVLDFGPWAAVEVVGFVFGA